MVYTLIVAIDKFFIPQYFIFDRNIIRANTIVERKKRYITARAEKTQFVSTQFMRIDNIWKGIVQ